MDRSATPSDETIMLSCIMHVAKLSQSESAMADVCAAAFVAGMHYQMARDDGTTPGQAEAQAS